MNTNNKNINMKTLITGGAGFIGSNLVDFLIKNGHEVIVIDNESAECHEKFYWNEKAKNYKYDICDYDLISPLFSNIDVVFHIAAEARIQPSLINPLKTVKTNVLGTCNILQASREHGVKRVIYSSTSSAYGRKNSLPFKEEMTKDCLTPYSVAKTAGEELCQMYYTLFGLETITLRYFNVYGNRQPTKGQYAPVIGLFQKQKMEGKKITIVGDGLQKRDFTNIKDVVEANIKAAVIENSEVYGQIFNIGTGKSYSVLQLAELIGGEIEFIPPRKGEARETLANIAKAEKILIWKPTVDLEDWLKNNL